MSTSINKDTRTLRVWPPQAADVAVTLGPPLLIVAALLLTGHNPTHAAQTGFVAALPIMVLALLLLLGVRRRRGPSQAGCHAALVAADHIREGSPPAD